jgi:acyl carrier protein phosphodiesterase
LWCKYNSCRDIAMLTKRVFDDTVDFIVHCQKFLILQRFLYLSASAPLFLSTSKMNFLAHIYLSGDNDFIKIGNFMADGIRGKQYEHLPEDMQKGIILHRAIDTYTDLHPIFREGTKRLHEKYHHYAGVIMDVFYDHFLAKNWKQYSDEKLEDFVARFYQSLRDNYELLTEKTQGMMPYMIERNWLLNYQYKEGIARILFQMDQRTKNNSKMQYSINELEQYYDLFEAEFTAFFEDLRAHAAEKLSTL